MFKKILIANRGEVAVRILRTCRDMGIATVAVYEAIDQASLHVQLANEAVLLDAPGGFMNEEALIAIAKAKGADAIHPGIGFQAEQQEFARAVKAAGLAFIGPSPEILDVVHHKLEAINRVRAAGLPAVRCTTRAYDSTEVDAIRAAAVEVGFPMIIKSTRGGRGRGEKFVRTLGRLDEALQRAFAEGQTVFGESRVYLEKAIIGAHQVSVQIVADQSGNIVHLGDREGSILRGNQKIVEESPSPCLSPAQREKLIATAIDIARLLKYQNVGTVEFLVDSDGQFYFSEIKARIQVEHPLAEMLTRVDLVREQIRVAAGEPLSLRQSDILPRGVTMLCRINAEDPQNGFLPAPGVVERFHMPCGPEVRVDLYLTAGCEIPPSYDPLIAKITAWGSTREEALNRLNRAVSEVSISGVPTNLPLVKSILHAPDFITGRYDTEFPTLDMVRQASGEDYLRDMAAAAAVYFAGRNLLFRPEVSSRATSGWHRSSRRLPD